MTRDAARRNVGRRDAIVIGAGQGGGPLAAALASAGRRTVLVERRHVGGTCVNVGCTPTKTLVASAAVAHLARRAGDYGVDIASVGVNMQRVRERTLGIVASFRESSRQSHESTDDLELIFGEAAFAGPRRVDITTPDGVLAFAADQVIVNTGQRPAVPPIDGLDAVRYLTNESIVGLEYLPDHLIVLGGGYVGLEFGQMYRRFGSEVTILQRGPRIVPREDADISQALTEILEGEGVRVITGATATRVVQEGATTHVTWEGNGASDTVEGTDLLVATGRTPNTDRLGLELAGIATDDGGYIRVDERLRTSAEGVWAIGDVTGGPAFTHVSYDDHRVVRAHLLGDGGRTTGDRILTHTMYTAPQLGRVGLTEAEARERHTRVGVAKMPAERVARGLETGRTEGVWKLVVDLDTERILGAAILGAEGGEIAALVQVAMMGDLPYTALRDAMFAHPTFAEGLNNLLTDVREVEGSLGEDDGWMGEVDR